MDSNNSRPRLLPHYIHEVAVNEPDRVCMSLPITAAPKDGFQDVTYRQLDKAIDFASTWMEDRVGISGDYGTVAYMGPQDSRYLILIIAALKTGHKLFVPSPRNSLKAHLKLLKEYECNTFLYGEDLPPALGVIRSIQATRPIKAIAVPAQFDFYSAKLLNYPPYPYNKTLAEVRHEPLVAMHTSGTTGLPKAIVIKQGTMLPIGEFLQIPSLGGDPVYFEHWQGKRAFLPFPQFHAAGMGCLLAGLYFNIKIVLAPNGPPSAELFHEVHVHGRINVTMLPPSILIEMTKVPEYLDALCSAEYVLTGGGPLAQEPGDVIASRTHLLVGFGTTEIGTIPAAMPEPEDWSYVKFSPFAGIQMRKYSDDLFESVFVRDSKLDQFQGIFYTFPDLDEYSTNDLWSKHPTKEGHWRHETRIDDIIVYSTGEKLNPVTMEGIIASHPQIVSALICGHGRFQSALLIEPQHACKIESDEERKQMLEELWPKITEANRTCPAFARIMKDYVVFTRDDKPLPKAGKGTIQRKQAEKLYELELAAVYDGVNDRKASAATSSTAVEDLVLNSLRSHPNCHEITANDSFFDRGLDSLSVMTLVRDLKAVLADREGVSVSLSAKIVYANPTAKDLAAAISTKQKQYDDMSIKLEEIYQLYANDLPIVGRPPVKVSNAAKVVLLTGSTGSFGSYILDSLLSQDDVVKVYCFNRGPDSQSRQHKSSSSKGLNSTFPSSRVQFIDTAAPSPTVEYLGLSEAVYRSLLHEVTHIIHNAWTVDFNLPLGYYAHTHVRRIRQLIDFSAHSAYGAGIHFISSIGTVANYANGRPGTCPASSSNSNSSVPEQVFGSYDLPQPMGYAQSKYVGERLLASAARVGTLPVSIYRVGQIAGPTTEKGVWNASEWFPLIIRSAKSLGALPETLGPLNTIDWIPVDLLSKVLVELVRSPLGDAQGSVPMVDDGQEVREAEVFHLANPSPISYDMILPFLARHPSLSVPTIPFLDWVKRLEEVDRSSAALEDAQATLPALKLLDFFKDLAEMERNGKKQVTLDVTRAKGASETLRSLGPVNEKWLDNWIKQWDL